MVALDRNTELEELRARVEALELELGCERSRETHAQVNRERYERLLARIPDGCVIYDERGYIVEANATAAELLGYPLAQLRMLPLKELQPELDLAQHQAQLEQLGFSDVLPLETHPQRGDGIPITLDVRICLFEETIRGRRYIALLRDVTDRQQVVRALSEDSERFRRRLDEYHGHLVQVERLATFGTLGAAVGHELNNLGQVYMAAADFLALRRSDPNQIESVVAELRQATELLAHHAKHLLAAGRPSSKGEETIDLGRQITDTVHLLRRAGKLKRTRIEIEAPHHSIYVSMNRSRLEQVIINLLTNAAEALSDGRGKGSVRAQLIDGEAVLTVTDEGGGIPADELDHVFDAYFSTKENHLGLGLLVVRQISLEYGGRVSVSSVLGEGTEVRCAFPAAEAPHVEPIPEGWELPPRLARPRSERRRKAAP